MQPLPHNLDAEQGLLGAIIYDNALLRRLPVLTPGMFFDALHGRIFEVCVQKINAGALADVTTLRPVFERDEAIEEAGGATYLLTLAENAALTTGHAINYANMIRETASRRAFITLARDAANEAASLGESFPSVLNRTEQAMHAILTGEGAKDVSLVDASAAVVEGLRAPYVPGVRTGLHDLDNMIGGLYAPDLIVLAGRPGMGKSSLATNIGANVARSYLVDENGRYKRSRVVAFFSLEMSAEQIAMRALSRFSGDTGFAYSAFRSSKRPDADNVESIAQRLPRTLRIDDRGTQSVASIQSACRDIRSREGALDAVIVDYLQLMEDTRGARDGRVQEVSAITKGLKALAKDLACPVIALSQLNRALENRQDKRPQLSDLRESGSIEQDADSVLFAFREHYYLKNNEPKPRDDEDEQGFRIRKETWTRRCAETENTLEIIAGKNRHGPVGSCELWCDLSRDSISDQPQEDSRPSTRRPYYLRDE